MHSLHIAFLIDFSVSKDVANVSRHARLINGEKLLNLR
jgi:hypothetical protein